MTQTRREFLTTSASAATVPFLGVSVFDDGAMTKLAKEGADKVVEFDTGTPSWHISHADDSADSLRDWADANDDRRIISEHGMLNMMTVVAPRLHVTGGRLGQGLAHKSYVELADLNVAASLPAPLRNLADTSAWDFDLSWGERHLSSIAGPTGVGGEPSSTGVAFDEDATVTPMADVKAATWADGLGIDTSGLTVGVIDSGLNAGSVFEDSNGNTRILDQSKDFISGDTVADGGLSVLEDGAGHGTFVTSEIAANASDSTYDGYLPAADILALRALDDDGSGSTDDIIAAVNYAVSLDVTIDAICMSLGSPLYSAALADAISQAAEAGIPVFVAVGNDRFGTVWTASPGDAEDSLGVTATTATGTADERKIAYFANVGPDPGTTDDSGTETTGTRPALGAPGMKIEALTPDSVGDSSPSAEVLSGTSMAAPCLTGAAGLIQAAVGGLSAQDVYDRFTTYARPAPMIAEAEMKHGLLDVEAAINETEPDQTQAEAMTNNARTRDDEFRSLSAVQGGRLARYL